MPYLKSKDIRGTPLCSLKYICNPQKTEDGTLVSAVNCMSEPKNAYEEMKRVYEFYSGRSFNEPVPKKGKAKVKLIHYIQSFDPQDNVTPEFAQRIAQATVSDMFGTDVQAVIATHTDTGKIHNHIIINVYDINGKRHHSNQTTLKKMKWISDVACMRHGIKPYDKTRKPKPKISAYNEWEHKKNGTSWKQQIRDRLDGLVSTAANLDELLKTLEQTGYEIKRGKYISIRAPEQERFVRTKTLGDDYTEENLVKRISENSVIRINESTKQFHDSYYSVYVSLFNKSGVYCGAKPVMTMCDFYYGQYETVVRERLNSIDKVRDKLATTQAVLSEAQSAVNTAEAEKDKAQDTVKSALRYFNVMKGVQKIFPKTEADKAAVATVKQYGLKSVEDVERLKQTVTEKNTELASLKERLTVATDEVQKYKDISDTYDMMTSDEDYISRLVREARDKCNSNERDGIIREQSEKIRQQIVVGRISAYGTMQNSIADMIMRLSSNVKPDNTELNRLIHTLAVMQADDVSTDSDITKLSGRMKNSAKEAVSDERKKYFLDCANDYDSIRTVFEKIAKDGYADMVIEVEQEKEREKERITQKSQTKNKTIRR